MTDEQALEVNAEEIVNVLCMKWGTKYPADYVNRLYSMVARNMQRKFRFVCLTEDSEGLLAVSYTHLTLPTNREV